MTTRQLDFIRTLAGERDLPDDIQGRYVQGLVAGTAREPSTTQASAIIDWLLKDVPRRARAASGSGAEPELEAGRYAVEIGGTVRFFKVDRPSEGRWAGRQFVNEVYGGRAQGRAIKEPGEKRLVLAALAADPPAAAARYGREIGRCGYCHIELTDELSRAVGIGPDCAKNRGIDRQALLVDAGVGGHAPANGENGGAAAASRPTGSSPRASHDECDRCGKRRELYYNEATGMALCEGCDRITDEVEQLLDPKPETTDQAWQRLLDAGF